MERIVSRTTIRAAVLMVLALNIGLTVVRAEVIQSTVVLPAVTGAYTLGSFCDSALARCTQNAMVSGFDIVTDEVVNDDELVRVSANYSADIFTNIGGLPGTFLGHLTLPGTALFTFVGRDPSVNPLGTFTTNLTDFAFAGMLNGNTFEIKQDPGRTSTGSTTILPATVIPPITYAVSGFLEISALYSFNAGPFTAAPPRMATVSAVPEPASDALAGSVLVGLIAVASRRRIR